MNSREGGRKLLTDHGDVLIEEIEPYITASIAADEEQLKRETRQQRKRTQVAVAGFIMVTAFALFAGWQWRYASQQRIIATQRAAESERNLDVALQAVDAFVLNVVRGFNTSSDRLLEFLRVAESLFDKLVVTDQSDQNFLSRKARIKSNIADTHLSSDDFAKSIEYLKEAHLILASLASKNNHHTNLYHKIAVNHKRLGTAFLASGDCKAAEEEFVKAISIWRHISYVNHGNDKYVFSLWLNNLELADLFLAQGDVIAAQSSYQTSLAAAESLVKFGLDTSIWRPRLRLTSDRLNNLRSLKQPDHSKVCIKGGGIIKGRYAVYGFNPEDESYNDYFGESFIKYNNGKFFIVETIRDTRSEGNAYVTSNGKLEWQYSGSSGNGKAIYRIISDKILVGHWGNSSLGQEIMLKIME